MQCILVGMVRTILASTIIAATVADATSAPARSGRANVEWVAKTTAYSPGVPFITALKMTLDEGWHTYWINPGEAGMPMSVNFDLPDGWTATQPDHPFPIRFKTGDLADFGYEGTVLFPIAIHPPAGANGEVEVKASFSWLVCDDSACVPGDATLSLTLAPGNPRPTPAAGQIAEAIQRVPVQAPDGWLLRFAVFPETLKLELTLPDGHNPADLDVFPLTLNIIHPAAEFRWEASGTHWTASVPKSPFAMEKPESLDLVINAPFLNRPIRIGTK